MKRHLVVLTALTAIVIAVSYIGWSSTTDRVATTGSRSNGHAAELDHRELGRLIGSYESRVRIHPNAADFAFLGQLYLRRGRETGDIGTYLQAQGAVDQALTLDPTDLGVRIESAGLRYTTHDFPGALAIADNILSTNPHDVGALVIAGDAQLELGRYPGAARAYTTVAGGAPDAPAIEVRLARLDYVQGKVEEARHMAAKALDDAVASALGGTDLAYYEAYRGQVEFDSGHYDSATAMYRRALTEAPGYYVALAGMGRARAAEGKLDDAISWFEKAVAAVPQPDFLSALGDLYTLKGEVAKARVEYGTVEVIAKLAALNRQVYNRLLAQYYADHGLNASAAVGLTETELAVRKDVFGYDAYAWALYQSGDYVRARTASDQALAQGTVDARLLYHSGLIARATGDLVRARADLSRALAISPRFDPVQAPRARAALDALRTRAASASSR